MPIEFVFIENAWVVQACPRKEVSVRVKRFCLGFLCVGGLYFLLALLAMMDESLQQRVRPLLRPTSKLVRPIYDAFLLHDGDPRVVYPVILSSLTWGLFGGVANLLVGTLCIRLR